MGNSAYVHANPLPNPVNDAGDMAKALTEVGFEVILGLDLDKPAFDAKVRDFARALEKADVAVFFYAGHGLQASGRNYLVPVDASLQVERDLDFEAVSVDFVLKQMEIDREGKTNVVFLDACRDNPLARNLARSMGTRSAAIGQGLAQVQTGVGTFIAYSTQPGNVALDGQGRNSPFTAALTKSLKRARPQPHLGHDRRAQGRAGGDRRQAGALGPLGPHRRVLLPAGVRAGHAAQDPTRTPTPEAAA